MRDMAIVCAGCAMTRRCRSDLDQQGIRSVHRALMPGLFSTSFVAHCLHLPQN
jgi:hypothetical protein